MNLIDQFLLLREEEQKLRIKEGDDRPRCIICDSRLYIGVRKCKRTQRFDNDLRCVDCLDLKQLRFRGDLLDIEEIEKAYLAKKTALTPPVLKVLPEVIPAEPVAPPPPKEEVMPEVTEVRYCSKKCGRKLRPNNKNDSCTYCLRPWQAGRAAPIKDQPLGAKLANLPISKPKKTRKAAPVQPSVAGLRYGLGTALKALFSGDFGKAEEWRRFIMMAYPKSEVEMAITAFIPES